MGCPSVLVFFSCVLVNPRCQHLYLHIPTNPIIWSSVEPFGTHMNALRIFQHTGAEQLRCPQTTFENLREPCRITNANHCKFRVIQSLITWKILENRGVMWNHVEPVESAYFKWSQGQIFPMPAGRGSSSKLISKPKEVTSSVLPSDVL